MRGRSVHIFADKGANLAWTKLARYYDKIHQRRNYEKDVDFLEKIFRKHGLKVRDILDVACGTGAHAALLVKRGYNVVGVDLNEEMLNIARRKVKNVAFVKGDMRRLKLDRTFDTVICMFNSIAYNQTLSELRKTLSGFREHLKPRGIVVFDTAFLRENFVHGNRGVTGYDDDELTIARFSFSGKSGKKGRLTFSYLIREGNDFNYKRDVHEFGLFSLSEIIRAMRKAGFTAEVYWDFTMRRPPKERSKLWGYFVFVGVKK
jgi:SAM-dependent methyltransferase